MLRNRKGKAFRVPTGDCSGHLERALGNAGKEGKKVVFQPCKGMEFNSEQEAYQFYNAYSWEIGFGIRHGNKYINKHGYKSKQDLLCSCEVSSNMIDLHLSRAIFTEAKSFSC